MTKKKIKCRRVGQHGESRKGRRTPEFTALHGALQRCYNKNNPKYKSYGGRGIKVCARWQGQNGVIHFLRDMGRRPSPQHSLDRRDNDGNYSPKNCRWATKATQSNNKRHRTGSTVVIDPSIRADLLLLAKSWDMTVSEVVCTAIKGVLTSDRMVRQHAQ